MSREIKFKVWDKQEKRMSAVFTFRDMAVPFVNDFVPVQFAAVRIERFEFLQFTGLNDKDGLEIFEGDIVNCYRNGEVFGAIETIEFYDGAFILRHRAVPVSTWFDLSDERDFEIEIIGNIYQNADLKI